MKKRPPTINRETEARTRFDITLADVGVAPYRPLKTTATLKRRALKKRPVKPGCIAPRVIE